MRITRISAQGERVKTRVAVYCRVSTGREEQEDSLEMQQRAYADLIASKPGWELAGVYTDVRSGLRAHERPAFTRMISDAMAGRIDRILCKSVSRFSRNTAECQKYTDMLKSRNVTVEFEKEHIRTDDPTSTFIFSLMATVAESESRSISENVKWGQRERVKRGEYNLGNNRILGYDCVDGKLCPNKDADAIRLIYSRFVGGSTISDIQRQLAAIGVRTKKGNLISRGDILYILRNETYKGDKLLQKTHPKDMITKRPDPSVAFESNYLVADHEAIVSVQLWDAAQEKLRQNKAFEAAVGHRSGQPHFLYGKVFCGECGAPMTRRTWRTGKVWICRNRFMGKGCQGRNVKEVELVRGICGLAGWEENRLEELIGENRVIVRRDDLSISHCPAPAGCHSDQR